MDPKTKRYFQREFTHRTVAAQWADNALLFAVFFALCYGWFLTQMRQTTAALLLSGVSAAMGLTAWRLWRSIRFDRFVKEHSEALRKEALLEHLMLLPPQKSYEFLLRAQESERELRAIVPCEGGFFERNARGEKTLCLLLSELPQETFDASKMLALCRRALAENCGCLQLYSTCSLSPRARELAQKTGLCIIWHGPEALLSLAKEQGVLPADDAVERMVQRSIAQRQNRRKQFRSTALAPSNARRYLVCALLLLASSFLTRYRLYYSLAAALCAGLALFCWKKTQKNPKNPPQALPR